MLHMVPILPLRVHAYLILLTLPRQPPNLHSVLCFGIVVVLYYAKISLGKEFEMRVRCETWAVETKSLQEGWRKSLRGNHWWQVKVREKYTIRSRFDCLVGKLAVQGRGHKFNSQHWVKLSKCVSNGLAVPELWRQTQADPWGLLSAWSVLPFLEKWEILSKAKQADKNKTSTRTKNPNQPN